jgi:hypothetical protein
LFQYTIKIHGISLTLKTLLFHGYITAALVIAFFLSFPWFVGAGYCRRNLKL